MASIVGRKSQAHSPVLSAIPSLGPPAVRPARGWAVVGGAFLAVEAWVLVSWVASGDAKPTPTGPTPVPGWMGAALWVIQLIAAASFVFGLWNWVIKPWRATGHLTVDGTLFLVFLTLAWQDSFCNYAQIAFTYNSALVNLGAWNTHLPTWVSPQANLVAEPLLILLGYAGLFFPLLKGLVWGMSQARVTWPNLGPARLIGGTFAVAVLVDIFVIDGPALLSGVWAYPGGFSFALFPDTRLQLPLHEIFVVAAFLTSFATIRFFTNDRGETIAERGLDEVARPGWRRSTVRFLALAGAFNVVFVVTADLPYVFVSMNQRAWPAEVVSTSYLVDGICGPGTTYACPGPNVPIPRRDSAHVGPDGRLVP
jgi:Spirocyclase AveC-like